MKAYSLLPSALFLIVLAAASTMPATGGTTNVTITEEIALDGFACQIKRDKSGQNGIYCVLSGQASGLSGREINIQATPRLPDGQHIKASFQAPRQFIRESGILQWRKSLSVKDNPQGFEASFFMPFKAMNLAAQTKTIVVRGNAFSGNIGSYADAAIHVRQPQKTNMSLLAQSIRVQIRKNAFSLPNPSGRATKKPNLVKKERFLEFSACHLATGLKHKALYSGVFFTLPGRGYVRPTAECPKDNVGSKGQAQFQMVETIHTSRMKRRGKHLRVPLDALALDQSQANRVIAVYYIGSENLWNVREFKMRLPGNDNILIINEF